MDDMTALLMGKNKMAEAAKNVLKNLEEEIEKKASNCQSLKRERKEKADDCFVWFPGGRAASMQQG